MRLREPGPHLFIILKHNRMKNDTASKKANTATATSGMENKPTLLEKFFMDMMKDIYWAEKHLVESLPKMEEAATTDELREAFADHLHLTRKHVTRLEKVFKMLGKEPEAKKCEAMSGLVEEANSIIKETKDGTMTRDVALIIAAQKVEHYEISTYGSMVQLARTMDKEDIASLLEKTLWEEEDTDHQLTQIAESDINPLADEEGNGENADNNANKPDSDGSKKNGNHYAASAAAMS